MTDKTSSNEDLLKASPVAAVELSEDQLATLSGGDGTTATQSVTVNKSKVADKAYNAMETYIRQ